MAHERDYTFTQSVDEYEDGKTYSLPRAVGRAYIHAGVAVNAEPATKKKASRKKRETAEYTPTNERATEDV